MIQRRKNRLGYPNTPLFWSGGDYSAHTLFVISLNYWCAMSLRYLFVLIGIVPVMCLADKWVSEPPAVICNTQEQVYKMVTALAELPPEEAAPIVYGSGCQALGNAPVPPGAIVV